MEGNKKAIALEWLYRFESSGNTVETFFSKYDVPFSRAQFFRYKKTIKEKGVNALIVNQIKRNRTILNQKDEEYLKQLLKQEPDIRLLMVQKKLESEQGCKMSVSGISRALKRLKIRKEIKPAGRPKSVNEPVINPLGGFELIVALAYYLGWPQRIAGLISKSIRNFRKTAMYKKKSRVDTAGRDAAGHFTKIYNQRKEVRANRFQSVHTKMAEKNWQSMSVMQCSTESIMQKSMAILSLPIITNNGVVRSVNAPLGQTLKHICGYDYKQSTIEKFLSELKYLHISDACLREVTQFWSTHWKQSNLKDEDVTVCYYVDGNTKALWSSQRIKQNKVTMLGRVMGCLEQVFIHDGWGHPVYFQTFNGHAPVGEEILGLFEKIEDAILDVPQSRTRVFRAIVMDSASNSVRTLRAFAMQTKYHYITPLDDNQFKERRIINKGSLSRYRYRPASLRELLFELEDSAEKGYFVRIRAVQISWDNGKQTVLLTSLPIEYVDSSEVVYSYFRRWPAQELQFKWGKAAVSLSHVSGYGRQVIEDVNVAEKQSMIARKIESLTRELEQPLKTIAFHDGKIANLITKERKIKSQCKLKNGKMIVPIKLKAAHLDISKKIRAHVREVKGIESNVGKPLKAFRKHQKEWLRLQGKETVAEVDVELDQIMTFHRVSLANLYAYFIEHFLGGIPISMAMLTHRLMYVSATIEETKHVRHIILQDNKKDPKLMYAVKKAIDMINNLEIKGQKGKAFKFSIK